MTSLGVSVCIRARPFIQREADCEVQWEVGTNDVTSINKDKPRHFLFDRVFGETETTAHVYQEIAEPIVQSAMQGFNGTVFAYGQTASGKTYTMTGSEQDPGIITLAINDVFNSIEKTPQREFLLRMSYMEIYNDNLKDLLATEVTTLSIREDEFKSVRVQGLVEKMVASPKDVMCLLEKGERIRHMGSTNMNVRSSRSHTIFKMVIESRERIDMNRSVEEGTAVRVAQLNFVDLAGSERTRQTGAEGQRFKEGCYINKSLMILGQVINQICKDVEAGGGKGFISFRDSKLTRILQSSLGGNSLTAIICTVTLASLEETESTLRFASSAKNVKNKPIVNEVLSDEALLFRQKKEINQLRKKIQALEKENELNEKSRLQRHEYEEKIEVLTRMLLVSSRPADFVSKKLRRETWCPGAKSSRSKEPSPLGFQNLLNPRRELASVPEELLMSGVQDGSPSVFAPPFPRLSNKSGLDDASVTTRKRSRLEDDDLDGENEQVSKKLKPIQDALIKEQENNIKLRREIQASNKKYEDLKLHVENNFEIRSLQEHVKMQQDVIEQFKQEKDEEEEEREKLQMKITELYSLIVDLERRAINRIENDSVASALQGEVKELRGQLEETCRQNRKLQEHYDEEMDRSVALNSSLKKLNSELDQNKAHTAQIAEEYEAKMHSLQSQLEASKSIENDEKSGDTTSLQSAITEKDALIKELMETNDILEKRLLQKEENTFKEKKEIDESEIVSENTFKEKKEIDESETVQPKEATSVLGTSTFYGERTACLEDAVLQCEMLVQEKMKLKQEVDDMVFQVLEKDNELKDIKAKVANMTSHLQTLEEQAQFDRDEKDVLFAEEKELQLAVKKLKNELDEANRTSQIEKKELQIAVEKLKNELDEAKGTSQIEKPSIDQSSEILKLKESVLSHERSARDAENLLHDSNFKLSKADGEIKDLKESLGEKEIQVKKLEADLQSYISMAEITGGKKVKAHGLRRSTDLNSENESLKMQLEEQKAEVFAMEKKLQNATENLQETTMLLESEREAFMDCNTTMENDIKSKNEAIAELEERVQFYTQELEHAKQENQILEKNLDEKMGELCQLQNLDSELHTTTSETPSQTNFENEMKEKIEISTKELEQKNLLIKELEQKLQTSAEQMEKIAVDFENERETFQVTKTELKKQIQNQNEALNKVNEKKREESERLQEKYAQKSQENSLLEQENVRITQDLKNSNDVRDKLDLELKTSHEDLEKAKKLLENHEESLNSQLQKMTKTYKEVIEKLENEKNDTIQTLEEQMQLKISQFKEAEKIISSSKEEFAQKSEELYSVESELSHIRSDYQSIASKNAKLEEAIREKNALLDAKDKESIDLKEKIQQLQESRACSESSQSPDEDLKEEISVLELQKRRCVNECKDMEKRLLQKEEEAAELDIEKKSLEKKLSDKVCFVEKLERKFEQEQESKSLLLSQKEQLTAEKKKVENMLKDKQNSCLAAESDIAKLNSLVEQLKAQIANLEVIVRDDSVKLQQVKLLEEQSHLSELEKNFIVVYHEFEQLTNEHKALVQSYEEVNAQLLERNNDADAFDENLKELNHKLAQEQSTTSELKEKQEKSELEIQELQQQLSILNAQNLKFESRLKIVDSERKNRSVKTLSLENDLKEAKNKLSEIAEECSRMEKQSQDYKARLEEAEMALSEKTKSYETLQNDFDNGVDIYETLKSDLLIAQKSVEDITLALEASEEEKSSLSQKLRQIQSDRSSQKEEIKLSDERAKDFSQKVSALEIELEERQTLIEEEKLKTIELEKANRALETRSSSLLVEHSAEVTKLNEEKDRLHSQLQGHVDEINKLKQKLSALQSEEFESRKLQQMITEKDQQIAKLLQTTASFEGQLQNAIAASKAEIEEQSKERAQYYIEACERERMKLKEMEDVYKERKAKLERNEKEFELKVKEEEKFKTEFADMKELLENHQQIAQDLRQEKALFQEQIAKETSKTNSYKSNIKQLQDSQKSTEKQMQKVQTEYQFKLLELQGKLRASEQRNEKLQSLRGKASEGEVIYPGSIVQRTKLDVQELEMAKLKQDLWQSQKTVAKYEIGVKKQEDTYRRLYLRYMATRNELIKLRSNANKENLPEPTTSDPPAKCEKLDSEPIVKKAPPKFDNDGTPELIILDNPTECPEECKQLDFEPIVKKAPPEFDDDGPPELIILDNPTECPEECKQQ